MKIIQLTKGRFARVSDRDYKVINRYKWQYQHGYATRTVYRGTFNGKIKNSKIAMHREVNKTPHGIKTDHRDGDGLNNQRRNLRNATPLQNSRNAKKSKTASSRYKGVSWCANVSKWRAQIMISGKPVHLGVFKKEREAAKRYDRAAKKHFGKFAKINGVK